MYSFVSNVLTLICSKKHTWNRSTQTIMYTLSEKLQDTSALRSQKSLYWIEIVHKIVSFYSIYISSIWLVSIVFYTTYIYIITTIPDNHLYFSSFADSQLDLCWTRWNQKSVQFCHFEATNMTWGQSLYQEVSLSYSTLSINPK